MQDQGEQAVVEVLFTALAGIPAMELRPGDVAVVGRALNLDVEAWSTAQATYVHRLLTEVYREVLEADGWDVDLLPTPGFARPLAGGNARDLDPVDAEPVLSPVPAEVSPTQDDLVGVAANVVSVSLSETPAGVRIVVGAPSGHPLRDDLASIAGATWDGEGSVWRMPLTRRCAQSLRLLLTGCEVTVDAGTSSALRTTADAEPTPDVTVVGERVALRFEHTADRQSDAQRRVGANWDGASGCWFAPLGRADDAVRFATSHSLLASDEVKAAAEAKFEPFDYDLTIDGLRGVPVSELHHVRSHPERGKTPSLADRLAAFGVVTVYDLLCTVPLRYLPRDGATPIGSLTVGEQVGFLAKVTNVGQYDRMRRLMRVVVDDGSGSVSATFFNSPWMVRKFRVGDEVAVYGRLDQYYGGGRTVLQMSNPIMDPVGDDIALIVPVYPQSAKTQISTWDIHGAAMEAVRRLGDLQDPLTGDVRDRNDLMSRLEAYQQVHLPDSIEQATQARNRLAFDELLRMQIALGMRRATTAAETGVIHTPSGLISSQFLSGLPYKLTGAQARVIEEVSADLIAPHPMHRLLQGDVGSGKAQPLNSLVLTPRGYKKMGDITVGQEVVTPGGEVTVVNGVYPQGERPVWRILLSDGTTVDADDEHLWVVYGAQDPELQGLSETLTTRQIREHINSGPSGVEWCLPSLIASDYENDGQRPVDPYTLGVLLGRSDSGSSSELLVAPEQYQQARVAGGNSSRAGSLKDHQDDQAQQPETDVPVAYLHASAEMRHAILQGLLDSNGEADGQGGVTAHWVSSVLAASVAWLARSLGGYATTGCKRMHGAEGTETRINLPLEYPAFRIESKTITAVEVVVPRRIIRAVTYVGKKQTQCIRVSHSSHMYVTDNFTPTHNTVIASMAVIVGVEGGFQGALMAPTEILATQLHTELAERLSGLIHPDGRPIVVDYLGGKTRVKERRRIVGGLADGTVDVVVGTHALLSDDVLFANLGIVVIDEQHRFGVQQRAALRAKGTVGAPDMLIMTATPIPRTAALTVWGDLAVSVLDELPPGRTPIVTTWTPGVPSLDGLSGPPWDLVRREVTAGHQAYIVASLVEDNETIAAKSATDAFVTLSDRALVGLRIGLVHGKQPRPEREEVMAAFKRHEIDVLVATTVIEVGVNVPNATVMVVLDAPRFGIAQLHQIRGRVGRGSAASECVLTGKAGSADAVIRMKALCDSTDGFYLSEVDLELRGAGSIFGARQSGESDLRVANLAEDKDMVVLCRDEAQRLLVDDPRLTRRPGLRTEVLSALGEEAQAWLNKS